MGARRRTRRWKPAGSKVQTPSTPARPLTRIAGGGSQGGSALSRSLLSPGTESHQAKAKKWKTIYRNGGPAATCVDAFPQFVLSNGFVFSCRDGCTSELDRVNAWADQSHINMTTLIWQMVRDSVITGTSYAEIVPDGGAFGIWNVVPREPTMFAPVYDEYGQIASYEQIIESGMGGQETRIPIPAERILALTPFPVSGEMYGVSLVERSYDEIISDAEIHESTTNGIKRHGMQKYQIKVCPPGESISNEDLLQIKSEFSRITANNDWITTGDIDIKNVDAPMANLDTYCDISLQRLAASFGVPDEFLGRGSQGNQATATARLRAFYTVISTIQDMVARTISCRVLDIVSGSPGSVWLSFGEVSPDNFSTMAVAFSQLRSGLDPDAVVPAAWARDQLGIPPDEDAGVGFGVEDDAPPSSAPAPAPGPVPEKALAAASSGGPVLSNLSMPRMRSDPAQTKTAVKQAESKFAAVIRLFFTGTMAGLARWGTPPPPQPDGTGPSQADVVVAVTIAKDLSELAKAVNRVGESTCEDVAKLSVEHGTRFADRGVAAAQGAALLEPDTIPDSVPGAEPGARISIRAPMRMPADPALIKLATERTAVELKGATDEMARRVARTLLEGYKERETIVQLAKRVREETGFAKSRARMIARTEFVRNAAEASLVRYKACGFDKVKYWAALDGRECDECTGYHGKIYQIDDAPQIPIHPNCRCCYVPIAPEEDDML